MSEFSFLSSWYLLSAKTQKLQIKIAFKDEVLEVIEKNPEIHKARNEKRALRVTEFNGE